MTYKTAQGDCWDLISFKLYGTEKYLVELMKANPKYIETIIFPANVELNVPTIQPTTKAIRLPAWKR